MTENERSRYGLDQLQAWCLLVLITILGHALVPISSPVARQPGSPFSASTIEVSTGISHKTTAARQSRVDRDPDGRAAAFTALAIVPLPVNEPARSGHHRVDAAPAARAAVPYLSRLRPRGPPTA